MPPEMEHPQLLCTLFQHLITLSVKNVFPASKPLLVKSHSPVSCHYHTVLKVSPPPPCKLPPSTRSPLMICASPLDSLQQLCILPVLGAPGLDTVFQIGPHKGRTEWDNPNPNPVWRQEAWSTALQMRFMMKLILFPNYLWEKKRICR